MKRLLIPLVMAVTAVLASTTPAFSITQSGHLCMTYGQYCAGANTIADGYAIINQSSGRDLEWIVSDVYWNGLAMGYIEFTNAPGECVDAPKADSTLLYVDPCSGVNGVLWGEVAVDNNGNFRFINKYQSENLGQYYYMTTVNQSGYHWKVDCRPNGVPCHSGDNQTFYWTG